MGHSMGGYGCHHMKLDGWMPQPLLVGLIQPGHPMVRVLAAAKIHGCCGLVDPSGLIQPEGVLHLLTVAVPPVRSASRAGVPGVP